MNAAELLREVGLLADGPVVWGRPVPAGGAGVFVVELTTPLPRAPIELSLVGKWIERVPDLALQGERPTSKALATRLGAFWLPSQSVVFIGATTTSIGGRVAAIEKTVLGDRRPHSAGHWLHTFKPSTPMRVWWTRTDAVEEYEDALLAAFASGVPPEEVAALPDASVVLPFANLRRPTGERRSTGVSGSLLVEEREPTPPPGRVVLVPDGDAEGARGEPPVRKPRAVRTGGAAGTSRGATRAGATTVSLTADGAARLEAELAELTTVRRPEVIARIRTAKELGDLKENADYTAAREEQSFLEGRIQAVERQLREAVITEAPKAGAGADIGSRVTVEIDGDEAIYTLVGSAESKPAEGRLSVVSPVGRALVGSRPGDEVDVETPRGRVAYRVVSVE
jgi:transcription elongation factor GreA